MHPRPAQRLWATAEPSDGRVLKHEAQTPDGKFFKRESQTQLPAIIESDSNLDDSKDLMMSGQSTPARGSYHNSPISTATPNNSSTSAFHAQHRLPRSCETFAIQSVCKHKDPRRCMPPDEHVTVKTRASQQTGFAAVLRIEKGFLSVIGGAELDDTILSMPLPYAELKVVPGHDNVLELKVKTPGAKPNGILVVVSDCSVRDRWLEAFSAVGVKIEGHVGDHAATKAYRNPPCPWAPSHISMSSEAEFNQLCSNDEPDGRALKREAQTQLRAYRNPPRPWSRSRIRFTSEADFDRLCSNDQPDGRPLKREAQTRLRAMIENLVDSKELLYLTFILAVHYSGFLLLL